MPWIDQEAKMAPQESKVSSSSRAPSRATRRQEIASQQPAQQATPQDTQEDDSLRRSFVEQLRSINKQAMQSMEDGQLAEALDTFKLCESIIRKTELLSHGIHQQEEKSLRLTIYNNIACVYQKRNELEIALEYLLKVVEECRLDDASARTTADSNSFMAEVAIFDEATAHLNACVVLSGLGRHSQALGYVRRAVALFVQIRDPTFIARATRPLPLFSNEKSELSNQEGKEGDQEFELRQQRQQQERAHRRSQWEASDLPGKFYKGLALAHYNEAVQHEFLQNVRDCESSVAAAQEVCDASLGADHPVTQAILANFPLRGNRQGAESWVPRKLVKRQKWMDELNGRASDGGGSSGARQNYAAVHEDKHRSRRSRKSRRGQSARKSNSDTTNTSASTLQPPRKWVSHPETTDFDEAFEALKEKAQTEQEPLVAALLHSYSKAQAEFHTNDKAISGILHDAKENPVKLKPKSDARSSGRRHRHRSKKVPVPSFESNQQSVSTTAEGRKSRDRKSTKKKKAKKHREPSVDSNNPNSLAWRPAGHATVESSIRMSPSRRRPASEQWKEEQLQKQQERRKQNRKQKGNHRKTRHASGPTEDRAFSAHIQTIRLLKQFSVITASLDAEHDAEHSSGDEDHHAVSSRQAQNQSPSDHQQHDQAKDHANEERIDVTLAKNRQEPPLERNGFSVKQSQLSDKQEPTLMQPPAQQGGPRVEPVADKNENSSKLPSTELASTQENPMIQGEDRVDPGTQPQGSMGRADETTSRAHHSSSTHSADDDSDRGQNTVFRLGSEAAEADQETEVFEEKSPELEKLAATSAVALQPSAEEGDNHKAATPVHVSSNESTSAENGAEAHDVVTAELSDEQALLAQQTKERRCQQQKEREEQRLFLREAFIASTEFLNNIGRHNIAFLRNQNDALADLTARGITNRQNLVLAAIDAAKIATAKELAVAHAKAKQQLSTRGMVYISRLKSRVEARTFLDRIGTQALQAMWRQQIAVLELQRIGLRSFAQISAIQRLCQVGRNSLVKLRQTQNFASEASAHLRVTGARALSHVRAQAMARAELCQDGQRLRLAVSEELQTATIQVENAGLPLLRVARLDKRIDAMSASSNGTQTDVFFRQVLCGSAGPGTGLEGHSDRPFVTSSVPSSPVALAFSHAGLRSGADFHGALARSLCSALEVAVEVDELAGPRNYSRRSSDKGQCDGGKNHRLVLSMTKAVMQRSEKAAQRATALANALNIAAGYRLEPHSGGDGSDDQCLGSSDAERFNAPGSNISTATIRSESELAGQARAETTATQKASVIEDGTASTPAIDSDGSDSSRGFVPPPVHNSTRSVQVRTDGASETNEHDGHNSRSLKSVNSLPYMY